MKAYVVGLLEMNNWNWYDEYYQNTAKLIEKYGGKYIASGITCQTMEEILLKMGI